MKRKVLVVDDSENLRLVLEDILADAGYEILQAVNGEQGVEMAQEYYPDVILLDVTMPVMNGFQTCELLKKPGSKTEEIKIIMLTANNSPDDIIRGLDLGADDYVTKPYNKREILARVRKQVKYKSMDEILKSSLSKARHLAIIGQLAGGIAHDLKGILNPIGGSKAVIFQETADIYKKLESGDRDGIKECLQAIERNAKVSGEAASLGNELVQKLVLFVRSGSTSEQVVQTLPDLIKGPLGILERRLKGEGVKLDLDFDPETPPVKCNAAEMKQITLNFVTNALYALQGRKTKELTITLRPKGDWVVFSVSDTGAGIPKKVKSKILNDFFTTKPEGKGAGIGLSTVQKIVDIHHGKFSFESTEGEGSTFTVMLPVHQGGRTDGRRKK